MVVLRGAEGKDGEVFIRDGVGERGKLIQLEATHRIPLQLTRSYEYHLNGVVKGSGRARKPGKRARAGDGMGGESGERHVSVSAGYRELTELPKVSPRFGEDFKPAGTSSSSEEVGSVPE